MGAIHEFVSPTPQYNLGITTHLLRQMRPAHLQPEKDGEPVRTGDGFILPGAGNTGPLSGVPAAALARCPHSELRLVQAVAGQYLARGATPASEYWLLIAGELALQSAALRARLSPGDLLVLREGLECVLSATQAGQVALARAR
jgi:hypothetical protein